VPLVIHRESLHIHPPVTAAIVNLTAAAATQQPPASQDVRVHGGWGRGRMGQRTAKVGQRW
jgi:hypothetical protein